MRWSTIIPAASAYSARSNSGIGRQGGRDDADATLEKSYRALRRVDDALHLGRRAVCRLCFVGIQGLAAIATTRASAASPGMSQRSAQIAGWKVASKYHALVYVVAGVISLTACCIPSLLSKHTGFNEDDEWRRHVGAGRR